MSSSILTVWKNLKNLGIMSSCLGIEGLNSLSIYLRPSVTWKSRYFFMSGDSWETLSNDFWGDVPWLLRQWETPQLGVFASYVTHFSFNITCFDCPFWPYVFSYFAIKESPKLESKFVEHVQVAIRYMSTTNNFDELVDPRTLAHHYLEPEPSHFILHAIRQEEKSKSSWDKGG